MENMAKEAEKLRAFIEENGVEFFDFGCSHGKSIDYCKKRFGLGGEGVGIDIDADKVASARRNGYKAFRADILQLPNRKLVRFCSMIHFLEHLDGFRMAQKVLTKAAAVSRDFIFIRQPFFDADGELLRKGYKLYWSDWGGHSFCMSSLQLLRVCSFLKEKELISDFVIGCQDIITDSTDNAILPISAPRNQAGYDAGKHARKSIEAFDFPVYREVRAVIYIRREVMDQMRYFVEWDYRLFESLGVQ